MRKIIRRKAVLERYWPGSKTQFDVAVANGQFPAPFKLVEGGRTSAWFEDECEAWLNERAQRRTKQPNSTSVEAHR